MVVAAILIRRSSELSWYFLFGLLAYKTKKNFEHMIHLCWILAIVLSATTAILAPITLVTWLERGKPPVEIFVLRGRSLPYVAIWSVVAIAAIVLAGFNGVAE